jgi:L-amino acid N-acyltransferase YncA
MHRTSHTEPGYRGQRSGHAALALFLCYACDKLGMRKESFIACIGAANSHSLLLFMSLGFGIVRTVAVSLVSSFVNVHGAVASGSNTPLSFR